MSTQLQPAKTQFLDQNGRPLSGGLVYFYAIGTETKKDTFQDPDSAVPNPNPIPLDSLGSASIWGSGKYRQVLFDRDGNQVWDGVVQDANATLTGNFVDDVFTPGDGTGKTFVPGVTTSLTLDADPGAKSNMFVFFDTNFQDPSQFSLNYPSVTFNGPIPVGYQTVTIRIGTTVAVGTPANGSVGDKALAWGKVLSRTVDSIAQLRALDTTVYNRATVTSYYGDGKGSNRSYWVDTSDTTSSDNGFSVLVGMNGARWKLLPGAMMDATGLGARPDNSTDNANALQRLFGTGQSGFSIPAGIYKFATGVTNSYNPSGSTFPIPGALSQRADIRGESMANSILAFSGSGFALNFVGSDNSGAGQGLLSLDRYGGFTLQDAALGKNNSGIFMQNKAWFKLEDIFVQYMATALQLDSCFTGKLLNLFLTYSNYGCTLSTNTLGAANALDFDRCTFSHNSKAGVFGTAVGSAVNFRTCTVESCGTHADYSTGGMLLNYGAYGYSGPALIDGCYFEHNAGVGDIVIDNKLAAPLTVIIRGCIFVRSDGSFFTRNNISVTSSGGGQVTVILQGNSFISANSYVPDPSKPFWAAGQGVTFVDGGGNTWNETTSVVAPLLPAGVRARSFIFGGTPQFSHGCTAIRNAAGDYTVTFNTPFLFANYSFDVSVDSAAQSGSSFEVVALDVTKFRFKTKNQAGTAYDPTYLSAKFSGT